MSEPRHLLVTGISGFLGMYLAQCAAARNYVVHGVDVVPRPSHLGLGALESYSRIDVADGGFAEVLRRVRPSVCIHAAGRASVGESIVAPKADYDAGPHLVIAVLEALRKHLPQCAFVLLSSAAVYGNPGTLPVREDHPANPISPYGFHKLQSEMLCREFSSIYGLRTAIVRIFSAYGVGLRRQVLWDICRQLVRSDEVKLRGTGNETRDFINGMDVARALLYVGERSPMNADVYNLAQGRETSIRELALTAITALARDCEPQFDGRVPAGDPLHWCADIDRISALGFAPEVPLESGVAAYARWCAEELALPDAP